MIATCQFCKEMIRGPEAGDDPLPETVTRVYRQLSMLVANHMSLRHQQETGTEITVAMALAGGAIAMRFVTSADPRLDAERIAMGDQLIAAFNPEPSSPLVAPKRLSAAQPLRSGQRRGRA